MGKSAPEPPDYKGIARQQADASKDLANQQTAASRPDITTPYSYQKWSQDPSTGRWAMQTGFTGPTAEVAERLRSQAAANMASPFDMSQFGPMPEWGAIGSGEQARQQAIDSAYGQATSRLDPMWQQREDATRTRLLNQGLTEGSEAYEQQMAALGRERNDAYSGAMNMAIGQGTAAGDSIYRNNLAGQQAGFNAQMMSRQQAIADALRQRGMPMQELSALQSQMALPSFQGASRAQDPALLQAAMGQGSANMDAWSATNAANADTWKSIMQLASTAYAMSDERVKSDVERLQEEALPGVPYATFEYSAEPGVRYRGVIAQDVARERPDLVVEGPDGLLRVHASLAPEPLP
jgi:hypothetical protein